MIAKRAGRRAWGRIRVSLVIATSAATIGSVGLFGWTRYRAETHIYSASGFGGYVGANRKHVPDTPLQRASEAYAAGRYADAEQIAGDLVARASVRPPAPQVWGVLARPAAGGDARSPAIERPPAPQLWGVQAAPSPNPGPPPCPPILGGDAGHEALLARRILAYSAARQSRYAEAKSRFETLRLAAYDSPDRGAQQAALGEAAPTLEEEGAFEEAVCTSALGDKRAAEAEFDDFMRHYPRSVLVHAAVKRIARYHGGDVPRDAEALWKQAMAVQRAADDARRRSEALCGPECLAELLRRTAAGGRAGGMGVPARRIGGMGVPARRIGGVVAGINSGAVGPSAACPSGTGMPGGPADVQTLAAEMRTSRDGTTLAALRDTAARHGMKLEGVSLTARGLAKQRLPLIALIAPGHYVLVEAVTPAAVAVWDPDASGPGVAGRRSIPAAEWARSWTGAALRAHAVTRRRGGESAQLPTQTFVPPAEPGVSVAFGSHPAFAG
jgi:hypothetical protein